MALRARGSTGEGHGKFFPGPLFVKNQNTEEIMKSHPFRVSAVAGTFALALSLHAATAAVVNFDSVVLPPAGYQNGSLPTDNFNFGGVSFFNSYDTTYGSWSGFAISNHADTTTAGYLNQYSAITGSGAGGSANYAVGYYSSYSTSTNVSLGSLTNLTGLGASITNTTYTALSMADGDMFSKKFGGTSGNDADWLRLTIQGFAGGSLTGTIDFYLADFRSADNAQDYIVRDWRFVDFSALGTADEIRFSMSSSDNGPFGMNTPSYFAVDHFLAVPEPSSLLAALSGLALLARRKR